METHKPHILKGALAGLIGGLIGTAAKSAAERMFPPRAEDEPDPRDVAAQKVTGAVAAPLHNHGLALSTRTEEGETVHWAFGALAGAAYGALAEYYPQASDKGGAAFGMTLCVATHEGVLPALGLQERPADQSTREKSSEMATHIVYGIVTETVRTLVRRLM
ncbi:MAG: DUF1440 domain-containing protein [Acidobacteria bacterium]|nr:DUF1440 domain-containing protein [Acidobacteriota bacterium]